MASAYAARGGASSAAAGASVERCDACGAADFSKQAGASSAEAQAARSSSPRVLIGDFNATPIWPLYRRTASQFTDAAVAVARSRGSKLSPLSPTWSPWPGMPKLFRIDHGFVRGLDVEEFKVFEVPSSDHSAIVMDLVLP